jgi:hypothetical protein
MQEAVRAFARLRLIHARPDLYIATVLHARCLLTVVSQVPIINFRELFMSFTSTIISACSLWLQLFFDLLYLVVKLVLCLLYLFACAARVCMIFSLLCSINTSFPLSEAAPSSGGRFVDASAASFLAACNSCAVVTHVGP